jgi:exopolysaccharide biosynthesis protein
VLATDPDRTGPAEAALTSPLEMADDSCILVLVNANPWRRLPGQQRVGAPWLAGEPVDICGLAGSDGIRRSEPEKALHCFWLDRDARPHIGIPAATEVIRDGVGGFGPLLRAGNVLPPETDRVLHPRTALGLDAERRFLSLVVVDGRNRGVSEGMSTRELAVLLHEFGCSDALNLDGGGSSILILAQPDGGGRVVNHPSDHLLGLSRPRPIPVALVVREN